MMTYFLSAEDLATLAYEKTRARTANRLDAMIEYVQRHHYHIISPEILDALKKKARTN
jgi:hypothetical protein